MLEIKNLCKRYGQTQALDNVQLSVGPGEIVGLFGDDADEVHSAADLI